MRVLLPTVLVLLVAPECAGLMLGSNKPKTEQMLPDQMWNEEMGLKSIWQRQPQAGFRQVAKKANDDVIQVLAIGDSITKGGAENGVESSWPSHLQTMMNEHNSGKPYQVENLGVNGGYLLEKNGDDQCEPTVGGSYKYYDMNEWNYVKEQRPAIVVISLGTNEGVAECNDEAFKKELEVDYVRFVKEIQSVNPKSKPDIYMMTPLPIHEASRSWDQPRVNRVNSDMLTTIMQRVAEKTGAKLVDVGGPAKKTIDEWKSDDGLHPRAVSVHVAMAKAVADRISAESK